MENINVLIVDDEPIVCRALERDLSEEGYLVQSAATGEEAIEKCKAEQYDLIFVDYVLPDTNGVSLCTCIKAICPEAELVFMTGCVNDDIVDIEMKFCEAGGKNYYLYKPFSEGEIVEVAKKVIEGKQK